MDSPQAREQRGDKGMNAQDMLEIIEDRSFPRFGAGIVMAPTYHAKLNGIPMALGDAIVSFWENESNPPLKLPDIPGFRFNLPSRTRNKVTHSDLESSCEYCHSLHKESRCPSCGAPRRAKKAEKQPRGPRVLSDACKPVIGGWERVQVTAYPPLT
jgi:hypothetical protein